MKKENIKIEKEKTKLSESEFNNLLMNLIIDLEKKYYKISLLNLKSLELFGERNKLKKSLKKIKKQLKPLYTLYKDVNDNERYYTNGIGDNKIIELDYIFKINTYSSFVLLKLENSLNKRLKILNKLRLTYLLALKDLKSLDMPEEKKYEIKHQINNLLKNIINNIEYEKEQIEKKEQPKVIENEKVEVVKITKKEPVFNENLINLILNGEDTSEFSTEELISHFVRCVKVKNINDNYIKCANDIIDRLKAKPFDAKEFYTITDAIKFRKYKLRKTDYRYLVLKSIKKMFKKYKDSINFNDEEIVDTDISKFNIMYYLLYDEKNYYIIQSLISNKDFVNLKKDDRHIVCYILELYLQNLEKILNKNYNIKVNLEYLKEVYMLFTKSSNLELTEKDIKDINNQIYVFISKITNESSKKVTIIDEKVYDTIFIKSESKKDKIKEEIKQLSTHHFNETNNIKNVNKSNLETQLSALENITIPSKLDDKDISSKENIILSNPYTAYSYNKGSNVLRISVPDISSLVDEGSPVDTYIYNSLITNSKLDKRLLKKFRYIDGKETPSITFKIVLDANNNPTSLYIYKSKIMPSFDNNTKTYNDLLSLGYNIEKETSRILNNAYLNYAKENGIPFIYSGTEENNLNLNTFADVSTLSKKLPDYEYSKVYNALTSGSFHYSNQVFDAKDFDLNLLGINYLSLVNQRIIKQFVLNDFNLRNYTSIEILNNIHSEIKDLINILNETEGYKVLSLKENTNK